MVTTHKITYLEDLQPAATVLTPAEARRKRDLAMSRELKKAKRSTRIDSYFSSKSGSGAAQQRKLSVIPNMFLSMEQRQIQKRVSEGVSLFFTGSAGG